MLNYLKTDPIYKEYFSEVWLWMDFPKRGNMPDTGIDLVAVIRDTGDYCAIQCKCYREDQTLEKSDIDSFFSLNNIRQRLQRTVNNTYHLSPTTTMINQSINRFL
jgi:predicted helicase